MEKIFVTFCSKEVVGNLAKARSVGCKSYKIDCVALSPDYEVMCLLEMTLSIGIYIKGKERGDYN